MKRVFEFKEVKKGLISILGGKGGKLCEMYNLNLHIPYRIIFFYRGLQ